jgi:hypothetical protein
MPRNTKTRKPTAKEASAIKSRVRNLVNREIGHASIVKDKMKEQVYSFIYPVDELRSLAFKITVSPVMSKSIGTMAHLVITPGKPPK